MPGFRKATTAGTLGLKAVILSLITLQILLWETLPELSKTRDAFEIAVPNLAQGNGCGSGRAGG